MDGKQMNDPMNNNSQGQGESMSGEKNCKCCKCCTCTDGCDCTGKEWKYSRG